MAGDCGGISAVWTPSGETHRHLPWLSIRPSICSLLLPIKPPQNPVDFVSYHSILLSPPGSDMEVDLSPPALLMLLGFPRSLCAIRTKWGQISVGTDLLLCLSAFP